MVLWLRFAGDLAAKILKAFHPVPSTYPLKKTSSRHTQDVSHCVICMHLIGVRLLTLLCNRYLFRRVAFRALQSPPTSLILRPRSITTSTRVKFQPSRQWAVTPFQKRFASEEVDQSTAPKTIDEIAAESPAHTEGETSSTITEPASTNETATNVETGDVAGKQAESTAAEALGSFSQTSGPSIESAKMNQDLLQPSAASGTAQATQQATIPPSGPFSSTAAASPSPQAPYISPPLTPNNTIYVGNLYFEVSEDGLQRHFTPFGPIKKARIVYDHRGLSKG